MTLQVTPVEPDSRAGQRPRRGGLWLVSERLFWVAGLAALAIWAMVRLAGVTGARTDLDRFREMRAAGATATPPASAPRMLEVAAPDLSLWDVKRIHDWRATLGQAAPPPMAVLRIPKIHLEVAVLPGTDDFVLNRAVGHIEDTALPGTVGNSGIAGHRDGFFRGLKDIAPGDEMVLETLDGRHTYRVERTWIVDPSDVSVLDPTPTAALTLVTCYPFYFIGSAPERFIVRAVQVDWGRRDSSH